MSCSQIETVKGPDGSNHLLVHCNRIQDCYEEASKACGKYKIINSSSQASKGLNDSIDNSHQLLIKCTAESK